MRTVLIVALDILKEATARKWFIALGAVITLALFVVGLALRLEVVDGALAATRFFGRDLSSDIKSVDVAMRPVFNAVSYLVFYGGIIFGASACADFGPSLLVPGRIEHVLALPVKRWQLLFGTFLGVMALAALGSLYGAGGLALLMGVKTGSWNLNPVIAGLLACVGFSAVYAAQLSSTMFIRSTALSTLVGILMFAVGIISGYRSEISGAFEPGAGRAMFELAVSPFPKLSTLADFAGDLAGSSAVDALLLVKIIAGHFVFGLACLAVGVWRFEKMDF